MSDFIKKYRRLLLVALALSFLLTPLTTHADHNPLHVENIRDRDPDRTHYVDNLIIVQETTLTVAEAVKDYGCEIRHDWRPNFLARYHVTHPPGKTVPITATDLKQYFIEGDVFGADRDAFLFCSEPAKTKMRGDGKITKTRYGENAWNNGVGWETEAIITVIRFLLWLAATVATWLLDIVSFFLGQFLGAGRFITHPLVQTGWPFVQGIANLGFILALLFIAAATTLRLEGYGMRRMLPRLLIAALLINFSLVIGAIIIDASRVVMAVETRVLLGGTSSLDKIGPDLIANSGVLGSVYEYTAGGGSGLSFKSADLTWGLAFDTLRVTMLLWVLVAGLAVITIGLFIRYVALLLLLIVAPMAYIAIALPNTSKFATQWWSKFLKYVIYGPVALFILILILAVNDPDNQTNFLNQEKGGVFDNVLAIAITAGLCVVAAGAARSAGVIGGQAIVSGVSNQARRAGRLGVRGAAGTGKFVAQRPTLLGAAVGGVLGGPGGAALGALAGRIGGTRTRRAIKSGQDFFDERRKYKKKKEEKRSKESYGRRFGQSQYDPENYAKRVRGEQWAAEAKKATAAADPALAAQRLRSKEVANVINDNQIRVIVDKAIYDSDNDEQLEAVITSPEIVSKMSVENQGLVIHELRNRMADPSKGSDEKAETRRLLSEFNRTVREVERRSQQQSQSGGK